MHYMRIHVNKGRPILEKRKYESCFYVEDQQNNAPFLLNARKRTDKPTKSAARTIQTTNTLARKVYLEENKPPQSKAETQHKMQANAHAP